MLCYAVLPGILFGCAIPIPMNHLTRDSRNDIKQETLNGLVKGKTSRQTVLLQLGEPDEYTPDESKFTYHWERITMDVLLIFPGGATDDSIEKDHILILWFDRAGVLSNQDITIKNGGRRKPPPTRENGEFNANEDSDLP